MRVEVSRKYGSLKHCHTSFIIQPLHYAVPVCSQIIWLSLSIVLSSSSSFHLAEKKKSDLSERPRYFGFSSLKKNV